MKGTGEEDAISSAPSNEILAQLQSVFGVGANCWMPNLIISAVGGRRWADAVKVEVRGNSGLFFVNSS